MNIVEPGHLRIRGGLAVLNVGKGDLKISFDKDKPEELAQAQKAIADMMRLGYSILVQVGVHAENGRPLYQRCEAFDPATNEYVVILPTTAPLPEGARELAGTPKRGRGRLRGPSRSVALAAGVTRATAVAPTAGG